MLLHLTHQIEIGGLLIIAGIAAAVIYVLTNEGEGDSILPFAMFGLTSIMGLCLVANAQLKSINSSIDILETQMAAQHARFHANKTGATRSYVVGTSASKN